MKLHVVTLLLKRKNNTIYVNLDKFIAENVTFRPVSMFAADIEANREKLTAEVGGKND